MSSYLKVPAGLNSFPGARGSYFLTFSSFKNSSSFPWCITLPTSLLSQQQQAAYFAFCCLTNSFRRPSSTFKDCCDILGPPAIIQNILPVLKSAVGILNSTYNLNFPLAHILTHSLVLGIKMQSTVEGRYSARHSR